jgi:gliding motility-associated protein GldM
MKSPFKFLDSYTKDDRDIFFGRDREIEELYQRVFDSKLLLVYGVSGTGKSSLIHCGLANKFQETDWLPLVIRRGGNIIDSMASSIKAASITEQQNKFSAPGDFKKGVRSLYLDHYKPVFFIFDQFEELFIFGDKEERKAFIHIVKSLFESDLQCRLIFVMREEYMAGVTEFEKYISTFFANRVRIEKMSHRNALEAIKEPCKVFNINLEEGFAESLLEKLSPGETDVELTYLQVFLDKIFRLAVGFIPPLQGGAGGSAFTLSLLEKTGNVSDLLGSFLDEQVNLLENPDEGMAVLKSFVSIKGSRRQLLPEEVSEYAQTLGQRIEGPVLMNLLQTFINLRILRDKDESGKYELRHDALSTKIYEKITLIEKEILEIRQFIDNAFNNYRKRGIYLTSEDLDYIATYESRLFLSKELSAFIYNSKEKLARIKRRRRNLVLASAITFFVILSGFTVWALIEKKNADEAGLRQIESIIKLNENFEKVIISQEDRKNDRYQLFEMSYLTHPFKLKELWDKALTIKKSSTELTYFINQLQNRMLSESEKISLDSAHNASLANVRNKSDSKIPNNVLFIKDKNSELSNVEILKQKIQNYKKTIYDQIERKDWDKIRFSIDLERQYINAKGDSVSWETANFGETTLAGTFTNLNNLITEINYIELDAVSLIQSWISFESFSFNKIQPVVIPNSTYVVLGSNYYAQLLLSAFDTRTNMEAYIYEGENILTETQMDNPSDKVPYISEKGKISFSLHPQNIGINKFYGFIAVRNPQGGSTKYAFSSYYYVGEPNMIISPVGGNILYRGIDNLLNISIPGVATNDIKVKVANGVIAMNDKGQFTFRADQWETTKVYVSALIDNTITSFAPIEFRVIDTPDPTVKLCGRKGGEISVSEIFASKGLEARLENFYYDVKFEITGFTIGYYSAEADIQAESNGSEFTEKQKSLISKLKPGRNLIIKDIQVRGPDGKIRDMNSLIFTIVE